MGSKELPRGQLSVKVFEANGTKASEMFGVGNADPYAIVKLADLREKTKVANDAGSEPVWNQTFTFNLPTSDRKYNELTITLYNENKWPLKHKIIGETRINVASLVAKNGNSVPPDWYEVEYDQQHGGWIYVAFDFTPTSGGSTPKKDKPKITVADNSGTRIPEAPKVPSTQDDEGGEPKGKPKEPEESIHSPEGADSGISTPNSSTPGGSPSNSANEPQDQHRPGGESESGPPKDEKTPDKAPSESPEEDQTSPEGKFEAEPDSSKENDSTPGEANQPSTPPTENYQGPQGDRLPSENEDKTPEDQVTPNGPQGDGLPSENEDKTPEDQVTPNDDQQSPSPPVSEPSPPKQDGSTPGGLNSTEKGVQDGPGPVKEGGESGQQRPGTDDVSHDEHRDEINRKPDEASENGLAKLGDGIYNAAANVIEASKGLGRKFWISYAAVPSLLISLLVLAAIRRKGRNTHDGESSDSRAFSSEERTWDGSSGMPTSARQKILFYRIYGSP